MAHDLAAWQRLGRAVKEARKEAGYADMKAWALKVERTSRTLLGLERGEPTGDATLERIEAELDWPKGRVQAILSGDPDVDPYLAHVEQALRADPLMKDRAVARLMAEYRAMRVAGGTPRSAVQRERSQRRAPK